MKEKKLRFSPLCHLVRTSYGEGIPTDVAIEYTERSPDQWYGDSETSVEIDEEKAREIITFLREAYPSINE